MVDARSQPGRKPQPGEAAVLVTRAEGWHFSEYQVHGAHKKYKPGWVATGAAATLELRLSTVGGAKLSSLPLHLITQVLLH